MKENNYRDSRILEILAVCLWDGKKKGAIKIRFKVIQKEEKSPVGYCFFPIGLFQYTIVPVPSDHKASL